MNVERHELRHFARQLSSIAEVMGSRYGFQRSAELFFDVAQAMSEVAEDLIQEELLGVVEGEED